MKKSNWQPGDIFLLENLDEFFSVGQIVDHSSKHPFGGVRVLFVRQRVKGQDEVSEVDISDDSIITVVVINPLLFDKGDLSIISHADVPLLAKSQPLGTNLKSLGLVYSFLNAYHGLVPWDRMADPEYYDKMLISPDVKPKKLLFKDDA